MIMLVVFMTMLSQETQGPDFIAAIVKGDIAAVQSMLNRDPSLAKAVDKDGASAVLKAAYYRKQPIVDLLLSSGVELNIFEAAATGQAERVRALAAKDPEIVNQHSPDGFHPLGLAAFFGHKETVVVLLRAGADINMRSKEAMKVAALNSATAAGRADIAQVLLENGADPNIKAEQGFVPMHEAALRGDLEYVKLLLSKGADLNPRTQDGRTPLTFAISGKQESVISFLRDRGASQ